MKTITTEQELFNVYDDYINHLLNTVVLDANDWIVKSKEFRLKIVELKKEININ